MRVTAHDIREMGLFKYYRLVRKWASKTYDILDADLELLIYLDCIGRFTRNDFKEGLYVHAWDKKRWDRLRQGGWIDVWRHRNRTTQKFTIFQTSHKAKHLILRMYRVMLGEEDLPIGPSSKFYKNETYTDKVFNKAIDDMIKDKNR